MRTETQLRRRRRSAKSRKLNYSTCRLERLEARRVLDSTVVFNELQYNPGDNEDLEWIELHSQMAVDMDLSDWRIDGIGYTFPIGTIVSAGDYVVIAKSPPALQAAAGVTGALGPYTGQLANGGERLRLINNSNRVMDEIDYGDDLPWPVGPDGSGATLAKINPNSATEPVDNWTASDVVGGTPGAANFSTTAEGPPPVTHLEFDAVWRYDDSDTDWSGVWLAPGFNLNDPNGDSNTSDSWASGAGLFANGTLSLPEPVQTTINFGPSTHYFRTEFQFNQTLENRQLFVDAIVDDGAVFYLNGTEVARINMPDGPITHTTEADVSVATAGFSGPIPIPISELLIGSNVLSVELHQAGSSGLGNESIVGTISPDPGFSITWDGNDGSFFSPADVAPAPVNLASASAGATTSGSSEASGFSLSNIIDGRYGDSFSWAPAAADGSPYAIVSFGGTVGVSSVAFGRDNGRSNQPGDACGVQCTDRSIGTYTLQFTRIANPTIFTQVTGDADTGWEQIGQLTYTGSADSDVGGDFTSYLRHEYAVRKNSAPIQAKHLRIQLSSSAMSVDELEVYGAAEDAAFGAEITSLVVLPDLVINEAASGDDASFFLELANIGEVSTDLNGTQIVSSSAPTTPYTFSSQVVPAVSHLQVTESELGFSVNPGDKLFLYSTGQLMLLDAVRIGNMLRGGSSQLNSQWLYPDVATPGAANSFALEQDLVINEILYHHQRANVTTNPAAAATETPLVEIDATTQWRYNETGQDLGGIWELSSHAVDGVTWRQGPAPIGFESASLPETIRTQLTDPATNSPLVNTYYFETDFTFSGDPAEVDQLELRHLIDDGAVFYLNGVELTRYNMAGTVGSQVLASDTASPTVGDAGFVGPVSVPAIALINGTNRLSVEVHQPGAASSDIVMAVELTALSGLGPGNPNTGASDSVPVSEEWFEIYNRSTTRTIDLTGWSVAGGIDFNFPGGTTIGPQDYLVVANDAADLQAKFPPVADKIIGNFSGGLSNKDDVIQLIDANKNPGDQVHYFEGGRWGEFADGGGSSLELRDPFADNRLPEAWAASDESGRSQWQDYSYTSTTVSDGSGSVREFIMGLLDAGEVLIDDISVIERPNSSATQRMPNGTFQGDTVGQSPSGWAIAGTQNGVVATDPDDPSNKVLHLTATAALGEFLNDAETDLTSTSLNNIEYEISYRAKWLGGSNQLQSHLYYNRIPKTTLLDLPSQSGTPGAQNTALESNIGPTFEGFIHRPAVPDVSQAVTVSVQADDAHGVTSMSLYYSVNEGAFQTVGMADVGDGLYEGTIPGQTAGSIIQFYVEGTDGLGGMSTFPAAGANSRALYQVQDGQAQSGGIHNFRIVMTQSDEVDLFTGTTSFLDERAMTNRRLGATVIYNESEVYYNTGVRLRGSNVGRTETIAGEHFLSFNVAFDETQKFRGVHDSVAIDRSGRGGPTATQSEILLKHIANHAGDIPSGYDDLVHVISPNPQFNRSALLVMARYGDVYLDSQYDNGSDGTVFKMEGFGPVRDDLGDLGADKESYRPYVWIRNNRAADDYSGIIAAGQVLALSGSALEAAAPDVIDVDQWARTFTIASLSGLGDGYTQHPSSHNMNFYVRPSDGRVLAFPWDWDYIFGMPANAPLIGGEIGGSINTSDGTKLLMLPTVERLFYGHMLDIINTTFNNTYLNPWIDHYSSVAGQNWNSIKSDISGRRSYVLNNLPAQIPFQINSNGGNNFSTGDTTVDLDGQGWIDVREVRLTGSTTPLGVEWLDGENWQLTLPVSFGSNVFALEAYNHQGALVGSDTITVTGTSTDPSLQDSLRITELNYNPYNPTAAELALDPTLVDDDFEFIEVQNVGAQTLNLTNVTFTDGIAFTFGSTLLNVGQRGVIAKNTAALTLRYGAVNILGQINSGSLSGQGERLTMVDGAADVILDFSYNDGDPWPERPDGHGGTLELIDPAGTAPDQYEKYYNWRGSTELGGSPGTVGQDPVGVVINEVLSHTDPPVVDSDSIELLNTTGSSIDIGGWYLSDSSNNLLKYEIPGGTMLAAGGYIMFDEDDFNPTPLTPGPNDFALSGTGGDDVWLVDPAGGSGTLLFVDDVHFDAAFNGESLGRVPDGSDRLVPTASLTLGSENSVARVGPLVISEVNYNPALPTATDLLIDPNLQSNDLEFIEVFNPTGQTVDLSNWRLRGGVDYNFLTGTTIGAGHALTVVSFDPSSVVNTDRVAAFRAHYGIDGSVELVGGYQGQLNNGSERITLQQALAPPPEDPTLIPRVIEDEVVYDDLLPWPITNPGGNSLQRNSSIAYGNDATSWSTDLPTPGTFTGTLLGDFNGDMLVNATDIDLLMAEIHAGTHLVSFDLTGDMQVTDSDADHLVQVILMTNYGDTDLDGDVDTSDLTNGIINFTSAGGSGKAWANGDTDGDGDVDTGDLTRAIINFTSAGGSGKAWANGDTDGDGDVDTGDLTRAIINFTGAGVSGSLLNVEHPTSNVQVSTMKEGRKGKCRRSSVEHPTPNTQHPTPNFQRRMKEMNTETKYDLEERLLKSVVVSATTGCCP